MPSSGELVAAQGQLEQETDDANENTGEWPDEGHLELDARIRRLLLNIGDAPKDEQRDTFHGQPTSACHQGVGQFMHEHGDKQQQGRDEG